MGHRVAVQRFHGLPVQENGGRVLARPHLTFDALQIPVGAELQFRELPGYEGEPLTARVIGSTRVECAGKDCAITTLTRELLHQHAGWAPGSGVRYSPYWYYQGERLDERRERLGV